MKRGPEQRLPGGLSKKAKSESLKISSGDRTILNRIPNEVLQNHIFPQLSDKDLYVFSMTCRSSYHLLNNSKVLEKRLASKSLDAVVKGNQDEAEKLINGKPSLLLKNIGHAQDYTGKDVRGLTPFQAALCADDVEMCEMMKPYFKLLENGQAKMEAQFKAVFPQGIETHRKIQENAAFDFSEIMKTIVDAPIVDVKSALAKDFDNKIPLHNSLDSFRQLFSEISHKERAFNIYHFIRALKQYDKFFNSTDDLPKRNLIWRQVVGWTQRFFSACWAQATAQDVYYIVDYEEKLKRSFKFRVDDANIFPVRPPERAGVGYDFAASQGMRSWGRFCGPQFYELVNPCLAFEKYLCQKQQVLQTYIRAKSSRETVCNLLK